MRKCIIINISDINTKGLIIMLKEILAAVDKNTREEVTLTKGLALIIIAGAFFIGMILGSVCAAGHTRRKLGKAVPTDEEFDADEYVKSLKFEDEE